MNEDLAEIKGSWGIGGVKTKNCLVEHASLCPREKKFAVYIAFFLNNNRIFF